MKVNNKEKIINLLKSELQPISGEVISNQLGISRTGVWKHIKNLTNQGYKIESSHTGYYLKKEDDILLPYEFNNPENIYYTYTTDSTMSKARELIKNNKATNKMVIIAEEQTEVIKKNNTEFKTPKGGLYFSVILKPNCQLSDINLYPIAAAVSVNITLDNNIPKHKIKWPFDNYTNQTKTSGIIHEYITQENRCKWLILGIGVNNTFGFPRKDILTKILNNTFMLLNNPSKLLQDYKSRLNIINKNIQIISEGKSLKGEVLDINQNGTIILKSGSSLEYGYIGNSKMEDSIEY